jgi:hypothetical protein
LVKPKGQPSVRARLVDLERERAQLERQVAELHIAARPGGVSGLQAIVAGALEALHRLCDVLAVGTLEERRALVRSLLARIRVEKATRRAVLNWYRLPRDLSLMMVELRGIEPLTPRLPASCSPS